LVVYPILFFIILLFILVTSIISLMNYLEWSKKVDTNKEKEE
jgi:SNF family Na+-dependent transporter